jgi:hypothetical protein
MLNVFSRLWEKIAYDAAHKARRFPQPTSFGRSAARQSHRPANIPSNIRDVI